MMPLAYDNTMLSYYKLCPRKYDYRINKHLVLSGVGEFENDFKAQYGVAFHLAMDIYFNNEHIDDVKTAFIQHWITFEGQDLRQTRTMENGLALIDRYIKRYPMEEQLFTVEHIEVPFAVLLDNNKIYCGRIDKLLRMKSNQYKGLIPLDHKTSTNPGFLIPNPNAPLTGYIWGAMETTGELINAAILDRINLYKTRQPDHKVFQRETTFRTEDQIEEWKRETIHWIDMIENSIIFPRNCNSCASYGRECEYMRLCQLPHQEDQAKLINDFYKVIKWEPHKSDPLNEQEVGPTN